MNKQEGPNEHVCILVALSLVLPSTLLSLQTVAWVDGA